MILLTDSQLKQVVGGAGGGTGYKVKPRSEVVAPFESKNQ